VAPAAAEPSANGHRVASDFLPAGAIRAAAEEMGLRLPSATYVAVAAALAAGRHVVICGPVGSGKTSLALAIAKAAAAGGRSSGAALVTAGADWAAAEGAAHVLRAAERQRWLIVDEIDRADLDRAFGSLSGFLAGLPIESPSEERELTAPEAWRLIATAEGETRASGALTRRFARIELQAPSDEDVAAGIDEAAQGDRAAAAAAKRLLAIREIRPLGAAPFLDAARHAAERNAIEPAGESELARECYAAYLAPHLTDLDEQARVRLAELTRAL
jgi:MoxR-like ATPase